MPAEEGEYAPALRKFSDGNRSGYENLPQGKEEVIGGGQAGGEVASTTTKQRKTGESPTTEPSDTSEKVDKGN